MHAQGLLLPLCQAGNCTLREAVILSSAIKRVSLPVLHAGAALLRIAEMPYSGTNSWFIRILLDKKYALPYRVVRAPPHPDLLKGLTIDPCRLWSNTCPQPR